MARRGYILASRELVTKTDTAGIGDSIRVRSDHRTARACMISDNAPNRTKARKQHMDGGKGWEPKDTEPYKIEFARREESPMKRVAADAERKCRAIEQILLDTATLHKKLEEKTPTRDDRQELKGSFVKGKRQGELDRRRRGSQPASSSRKKSRPSKRRAKL